MALIYLKCINFGGYKFSRIFILADDCEFQFNFAGLNFRGLSRIDEVCISSWDLNFADLYHIERIVHF